MAVYFQLARKGSTEPQRFIDVDNAICAYLGISADEEKYALSWYDTIGLRLALGRSFEQIGTEAQEAITTRPQYADWWRGILCINHFLAENYTVDAWRGWS